MARSLLFVNIQKFSHIALLIAFILCFQGVKAQTILLPGDIVIISANSGNHSFGIIPLIDIEKNTSIYFSNSLPDEAGNHEHEVQILFKQSISAGTNVNIGSNKDSRVEVKGALKFGEQNHLYVYQRAKEIERYLFGIAWGGSDNKKEDFKPLIPPSISKENHTFVHLGDAANYQYFIRNGASGTAKMLLRFVGEAENWRSSKKPFNALGTSFTLLEPPVIMFTNSYSGMDEADSSKKLEVAIFEHDGSRLTVDVVYDSLRSITNRKDYAGFTSASVNFTGLVGDGVYDVDIPISDDSDYEGNETGIFTLKNLSNGSLGDFISHSLIIFDNEIPDVDILSIQNSTAQDSYIQIKNNEKGVISLKGWSLQNANSELRLWEDISLMPGESIKLVDITSKGENSDNVFRIELNELLEKNGGEILLTTIENQIISRKNYNAEVIGGKNEAGSDITAIAGNNANIQKQNGHEQVLMQKTAEKKSGLKVLPSNPEILALFPEMKFQSWNEHLQTFEDVAISESDPGAIIGYFENLDEAIKSLQNVSLREKSASSKLDFSISATDANQNDILDGLEGLNLIYNDLNTEIPVDILLQELEKLNPELNFSSHIYTMDFLENGRVAFNAKSRSETVEAGAPFWLMLKDFRDKQTFSLDESAFENIIEADSVADSENMIFTIQDGELTDQISIGFSEGEIREPVKDISAYSAFNFPAQQELNIAIQQGNERYTEMSISNDSEQNISLPLFLSSSSGVIKFKFETELEIPPNWEIFIEDKKRERLLKVEEGRELLLEVESSKAVISNSETENESQPRYYLTFKNVLQDQATEIENTLPTDLELYQNYPNPFNPFTTISFYMPEPGEVKLSVFNIVGQPVAVLVNGTLSAGHQQFDWDATERPSGMYIYQLEVGNKVLTRKMTLVK